MLPTVDSRVIDDDLDVVERGGRRRATAPASVTSSATGTSRAPSVRTVATSRTAAYTLAAPRSSSSSAERLADAAVGARHQGYGTFDLHECLSA